MSLSNASQQGCWEKLALFGLHSKSQKLGWNSYAGRTRRARAVCTATGERASRALIKARRGFGRDGRLLSGWVLLPGGIATYQG